MKKSEVLFEKYSIKPVLGVIPENKDKELMSFPKKNNFWEQVRSWQDRGWEIAMHGHTHVYDKVCKKEDYFNHGGGSEFCGHNLKTQITRIKNAKLLLRTSVAYLPLLLIIILIDLNYY